MAPIKSAADGEDGDKRGTDRGVVGGFRRDDAAHGTLAELLRVFGGFAGGGVGKHAWHGRAHAGNDAEQPKKTGTDDIAKLRLVDDRKPVPEQADISFYAVIFQLDGTGVGFGAERQVEHLRYDEHGEQTGDEGQAAHQHGDVEIKAGKAGNPVPADKGVHEAEAYGDDALDAAALGEDADEQKPHGRHDENFAGPEMQDEVAEDGHEKQHHQAAKQTPAERGDVGDEQGIPGFPLLREGWPSMVVMMAAGVPGVLISFLMGKPDIWICFS